MTQADEIRKRITELEAKLADQELLYKRRITLLESDLYDRQEEVKSEITNLIYKEKTSALDEFNIKVAELRNDLERHVNDYINSRKEKDEELRKERERFVKEIEAEKERLESVLNSYKEARNSHLSQKRELAERKLSELTEHEKRLSDSLCNTLYSEDLDIIRYGRENVIELIKQSMYEAAIGQSSILILDCKTLEKQVDKYYQEWETAFSRLRAEYSLVNFNVELFEHKSFSSAYSSSFNMNINEMDFWSRGEYSWMKEFLDSLSDLLRDVLYLGIDSYLRKEQSIGVTELADYYYKLKKEKNHIYAILNCVEVERVYSDERYVWGKTIAEVLSEAGYLCSSLHWDEPDLSVSKTKWFQLTHSDEAEVHEDQAGSLILTFFMGNKKDMLSVYISPEREHGVCIRNILHMFLHMQSYLDDNSKQRIIETNISRLTPFIPGKWNIYGNDENICKNRLQSESNQISIKAQENHLNIVQNGVE